MQRTARRPTCGKAWSRFGVEAQDPQLTQAKGPLP